MREEARSYRVDPELRRSFLESAERLPAAWCTGYCCHSGVYVSLPHRELILRHSGAVQAAMDPDQEKDPARWFEQEPEEDADFEGGWAVGTELHPGGDRCVFLNAEGRCVLQMASARDPSLPQLKPFFCRLFPLTVVDGELTYDDHCDGEQPCCTFLTEGEVPVVQGCEAEFRVALDEEDVARLKTPA